MDGLGISLIALFALMGTSLVWVVHMLEKPEVSAIEIFVSGVILLLLFGGWGVGLLIIYLIYKKFFKS